MPLPRSPRIRLVLACGLAALVALAGYWFMAEYRPGEEHYRLRPTSWWDRELTRNRVEAERLRTVRADAFLDAREAAEEERGGSSDPFTALRDGEGDAVPVLAALLDSADNYTRRWAAARLGALGEPARPALPTLVRMLGDGNYQVRESALGAAGRVDPEAAAAALAAQLGSPDPAFRRWAASRLGLGDPEGDRGAVPTLVRLLGDPDKGVREQARLALGRIDPQALADASGRKAKRP
jgi:HEAT repeat protein